MTREQARFELFVWYGIMQPTEQQLFAYTCFGDNASFLKKGSNSQIAENGGNVMSDKIQVENALLKLKGVRQMMRMFCNSVQAVVSDTGENGQETLHLIEDALNDGINDLEKAIYKE